MTKSALKMSPSRVAHYFFQNCERFLRYSATPSALRESHSVPRPMHKYNAMSQQMFNLGYAWEEAAIRLLPQELVSIAEGTCALSERRFSVEKSIQLFRELQPTNQDDIRYIYQASLRATDEFYQRFGIDSQIVAFSDCHPDLIEVSLNKSGQRVFRVIDVKRSERVKATHRIQILLYTYLLEALLNVEDIDGVVETDIGGVWLGDQDGPEWVNIDIVSGHVERFLSEDLMRICTRPAPDARWHLSHQCEWCEHFEHCMKQAHDENDLSRLPGLSSLGKRFLNEEGVHSIEELNQWLDSDDVDEILTQSASLTGKRRKLSIQSSAFLNNEVIAYNTSTAILPKTESIRVLITAQTDALSRQCYLIGSLVQFTKKAQALFDGDYTVFDGAKVWVADRQDSCESTLFEAIDYVMTLFEEVDAHNSKHAWGEQLSIQCYTHSSLEKKAFEKALISVIEDPNYGEAAARLLLYFTSPESIQSTDQTNEPLAFPLTPVINAQAKLLATPISVSTTLPESLTVLRSRFEYERDESIHYPLGHGFKPDVIDRIWRGEGNKTVAYLQRAGQIQLRATANLLRAVRDQCIDLLNTYPPKFTMPLSNGITDPLLSKLAFFTSYEDLLSCLETRAKRDEEVEQSKRLGQCIALEVDSQKWFKVINHPQKVESGPFAYGLLGAETPKGYQALLAFNDIGYRKKRHASMKSPYFYPTNIKDIRVDQFGRVTHVMMGISGKQYTLFEPGDRFLFYTRYVNGNADRMVQNLQMYDDAQGHTLMDLFRSPKSEVCELAETVKVALASLAYQSDFTESQLRSFQALCQYSNVTLWGPPGTGKSYFISTTLAHLFHAHIKANVPFKVMINSFTHAAIENVLGATMKRIDELNLGHEIRCVKAGRWRGETKPSSLLECSNQEIQGQILDSNYALIGSTVYGCMGSDLRACFDLVVIDEASQVKLTDATITIGTRKRGGRLLLAGDHEQLPPITKSVWPTLDEQPQLNKSVLEAMFVKGHPALGCMLQECFRMCGTLTQLVAEKIYGPNYQPSSDDIAQQRLRWQPQGEESQLIEDCLDPEYPFVIVSLEGSKAGQVNLEEAQLTTELTVALNRGLSKADGSRYDPYSLFYGDKQNPSGLFIVSPHHVQIDALRRALEVEGFDQAFVDTVDKMQGQEAECVFVSYGVSDAEYAMKEAEFIYIRNRLNVAVTRARTKVVLMVPRPLLDAPPEVLNSDIALKGLDFLRHLYFRAAASERSQHQYAGLDVELVRLKR
jgi:DNA replication ATP-dependent helicase Dna2